MELGLPNGGISEYSTKIINEKKAILTDRRKTPNPSPPKGYHKREAEASRPWPKPAPKPKSSMSFQVGPLFENKICAISNHYVFVKRVELGLPNNGISKYSTKIINEKKAILTDRRKTPDPSPSKGYHKREASRPWPKPKSSRSFQVYS